MSKTPDAAVESPQAAKKEGGAAEAESVYSVDELISYISRFFTLKTGDLLYTGTPAGHRKDRAPHGGRNGNDRQRGEAHCGEIQEEGGSVSDGNFQRRRNQNPPRRVSPL